MNTSLYVLSAEYHALASKLMESDLDDQTISDTLEGASGDLEVKAVNVAMFVRNLEASAEAINEAIKGMNERKNAIEKKADSIRQYLFDNMKRCEINKIESPYFALTIKNNPPSVVIDDASLLPVEFMRQPIPPLPTPDKTAIKAALQAGKEVLGAHIEQSQRLEIK